MGFDAALIVGRVYRVQHNTKRGFRPSKVLRTVFGLVTQESDNISSSSGGGGEYSDQTCPVTIPGNTIEL